MASEIAVAAAPGAGLARRSLVTAAAVALLLASERVVLPFLDLDAIRALFAGGGLLSLAGGGVQLVSWGALGLGPLALAFVFVELVAAAVPGLRPLRHGSAAGRARLTRAAWALGIAFSAIQGWALAVALGNVHDTFGNVALLPTLGPMLGVAAAIVVGTVALGAAAVAVTRHGLGNGFAVLLAAGAVETVLAAAVRLAAAPRGTWTEGGALLVIAAILLPLVFAARPRRDAGPRIPVPTCGLVIVDGPVYVLGFPSKLAGWIPAVLPLAAAVAGFLQGAVAYAAASIAVVALLALALSRVFFPPEEVVRAYARTLPEPAVDAAAVIRRALWSANARSLALAVGVATVPLVAWALGVPAVIPPHLLLCVFVIAAVARDLREEAVARASGGASVAAWPVHRVYLVEPVLAALSRAGIPAHARGRHYRVLFHVFAPYAPIEILVPPERADEASAICSAIAAGPGGA